MIFTVIIFDDNEQVLCDMIRSEAFALDQTIQFV
jgi:hypothetical protein